MLLSGTDGSEKHVVLGVETRNKCLYVVSDQLGTLESLYEVTPKWVPGERGVYYNYTTVGVFFTL